MQKIQSIQKKKTTGGRKDKGRGDETPIRFRKKRKNTVGRWNREGKMPSNKE